MEEDTSKNTVPTQHKVIIILDGERPCYIGYADAAQEKRIMEILTERRRRFAS